MDRVRLAVDRSGFLRRECPFCARHFKVRPGSAEEWATHRAFALEASHANPDEVGGAPSRLFCAYCGSVAPAESWLTRDQKRYLEKAAEGFGLELQFEQLGHVHRTLDDNPRPTFLPVKPAEVLPMVGDADDLAVLHLPCCAEPVKVAAGWTARLHCPRCGTEHQHGPVRVDLPMKWVKA